MSQAGLATTVVEANGHTIDAEVYRGSLISWGKQYFRPLAWRLTEDPYRILIAEVMLHRTQAVQVVPVYKAFIEKYPNLEALALATSAELHKDLYPLGLHWRTGMIPKMADELMTSYRGVIPVEKSDLVSLDGVSQYIASAVRCFAWNLPEPLVDTNTIRVVGRLFGLKTTDSSRRNRYFHSLIRSLVDPFDARTYNYALLDLADEICIKRARPDCKRCPVRQSCVYGAFGSPSAASDGC